MRRNIKQIMEITGVDEATAGKIEYQMECNAFDFSAASNRMFKLGVKEAIKYMK